MANICCSKCLKPLARGNLTAHENIFFTCQDCEELTTRNQLYLTHTSQGLMTSTISDQRVSDQIERREEELQKYSRTRH